MIWFLYKEEELKVSVCQKSSQMITCVVKHKIMEEFLVSAVYAKDSATGRQELWQQINSLNTNRLWLLMGDFNCIRFVHEKLGGDLPEIDAIEDFNRCLYALELEDLKWWGQKFTWWNKREGGEE